MMWDVFVSHASEDKDFTDKLVDELKKRNLKTWYDKDYLLLGDSLLEKIDEGLLNSRYGIVVLSPHFFSKGWPKRELDGLMAKETDGIKVILPIWHNIDKFGVMKYSPILAGRFAARSSDGAIVVAQKILKTINKKDDLQTIDPLEDSTNYSEEEESFLISAIQNSGVINVIETDGSGKFVSIGSRGFYDPQQPKVRIMYLEILEKYEGLGLIRRESDIWFVLSSDGMKLARKILLGKLMTEAWILYDKKKEYLKSLDLYKQIADEYPELTVGQEAQKMIGINYSKLEKWKLAEDAFKKAIDLGNPFASAYYYYGTSLYKNNKIDQAKEIFRKALIIPKVPNWIKRGVKRYI